jgi:hypothetical protein
MRRKTVKLQNETGHVGVTLATLVVLVGTILLAIGLGQDSTGPAVAGAIVLGIGSIIGASAPHVWLRSVYRRLDRVDPDDPDVRSGFRIQF